MPKFGRKRHIQLASQISNSAPITGKRSQDNNDNDNNASSSPAPKSKKLKKSKGSSARDDVLPLLEQLASKESAQVRLQALYTIASAIPVATPSDLRLYLSKNLIGILLDRMCDLDEAMEARAEAVSGIRNVAVSNSSDDVCREMFNKNIIDKLLPLFNNAHGIVYNPITQEQAKNEPTSVLLQLAPDLLDNLLTILLAITNASHKACNTLASNEAFVTCLVHILTLQSYGPSENSKSFPPSLCILAGNILYALLSTQEFAEPTSSIPDIEQLIQRQVDNHSEKRLLKMLSIILLYAISEIPSFACKFVYDVIEKSNLADICQACINLPNPSSLKLSERTNVDLELSQIEQNLFTLQLALEILSETALDESVGATRLNINTQKKTTQNGNDDMETDEPKLDAQMEEDEEIMQDAEQVWANDKEQGQGQIVTQLFGNVATLVSLAKPTQLAYKQILPESDASMIPSGDLQSVPHHLGRVANALTGVSAMAFEAIHNLLLISTNITPLPQDLWTSIMQSMSQITHPNSPNDPIDFTEKPIDQINSALAAGIGAAWALCRDKMSQLNISPETTPYTLQVYNAVQDVEVRERCIGFLACLAMRPNIPLEENESISKFFLSIDGPDALMTLQTQALDAIIDIYSDEDAPQDQVFRENNFVSLLEERAPRFKDDVKHRIDRRKDSELRDRAEGVSTNLFAFIKYRKSLKL